MTPEGRGTRLVLQHEGIDRDDAPAPPLFWDDHLARLAHELVGVGVGVASVAAVGVVVATLALRVVAGRVPDLGVPEYELVTAGTVEPVEEAGSPRVSGPEGEPLLSPRTGGRRLSYYDASLPAVPLLHRVRQLALTTAQLAHRTAATLRNDARIRWCTGVRMWLMMAMGTAWATWSVVGTDGATGEIGGAGTSCVGSLDVSILFAAAPGVGAVHAQAFVNVAGRDRAAELLALGATPQQALDAITDPSFDSAASLRQYGVVDLSGSAVAWTGSDNGDWAGDLQGTDGTYTYSAQGNILTGAPVVQRTADAFVDPGFCDLADKLMGGLEAGAAPGEGDSRCTPDLPSDSAFIRVLDAAGATRLDLSVVDTSPADPLVQLRTEFDVWRAANPCPAPTTPADTADTADTASTDTGPTGPTGPTGSTPSTGPGTTPPASDPLATDASAEVAAEGTGCGCTSAEHAFATRGWWSAVARRPR